MVSLRTRLGVLALTLAVSVQLAAQPAAPAFAPGSGRLPAKSVNVLIVPLDEIDESVLPGGTSRAGTAQATAAATLPPDPSYRPPGRAQLASAALRRALLRAGFSDVLSAVPDSPVIQRVTNDRRLSPAVTSTLQKSVGRIVALTLAGATASAPASATAMTTPATATPAGPQTDTTTAALALPLAEGELAEQTRIALRSAARVGQALNYRAVVVLAVVPRPAGAALPRRSTYAMLVADASRERGQVLTFEQSGADNLALHEAAATAGSSRLASILSAWTPVAAGERTQQVTGYIAAARAAMAGGDTQAARDALNQALAIEPSRSEANVLLGDVLQENDPIGAAAAYRRALESSTGNTQSGQMWAKIAVAYARSRDWPRTLDAARRALALNYDSGSLRQVMATAQFGRAELFRAANRPDSADAAAAEASQHLERARELAPDDPDVARLLSSQLLSQRRYGEALPILERFATQFPRDVELQTQYAVALTEQKRYVNAFAAWSRVWKMSGTQNVPLTAPRYRSLAEGFDVYASDLARQAAQLSGGVLTGTLPRESALLQLNRVNDDMQRAEEGIKIMQPPAGQSSEAAHGARVFGADLLNQAVNAYRVYVETGEDIYRSRAAELHRQAVNFLNTARSATY